MVSRSENAGHGRLPTARRLFLMKTLSVAAVVVAVLAVSGAGPSVSAQVRWTGGAPAARPSPPARPAPPSPLPLPPLMTTPPRPISSPPFRSSTIYRPLRPHRAFPVRLPWFGLVAFDYAWWGQDGFTETLSPPESLGPPGEDIQRPTGGLQIDVEPRRALVYVDGRQAGIVDEFSGYYRHLDLAAGPHIIELLADGYEPLSAEVLVTPGRTTTYRGTLNRR